MFGTLYSTPFVFQTFFFNFQNWLAHRWEKWQARFFCTLRDQVPLHNMTCRICQTTCRLQGLKKGGFEQFVWNFFNLTTEMRLLEHYAMVIQTSDSFFTKTQRTKTTFIFIWCLDILARHLIGANCFSSSVF